MPTHTNTCLNERSLARTRTDSQPEECSITVTLHPHTPTFNHGLRKALKGRNNVCFTELMLLLLLLLVLPVAAGWPLLLELVLIAGLCTFAHARTRTCTRTDVQDAHTQMNSISIKHSCWCGGDTENEGST